MTDYKKIREEIYEKHSKSFEKLHKSETEDPAIRLVRPLQTEYLVIGFVLSNWGSYLYKADEDEFVGKCMTASFGTMNPTRLREIYKMLMEEAGL